MMRIGGNKRLREFFEEYQMPKDVPIDWKYKTKAAVYYRETVCPFLQIRNLRRIFRALAKGRS